MLTYYGLRIGLALATIVPVRLAYWICSVVGNLAFFFNAGTRRAVQDNMRHVFGPGVGRRQLNRVCRYICRNTVKNYYELLLLPRLTPTDLEQRVHIAGIEHLDAALARGHGVILYTGHLGNFNLVVQVAAARGYPCNIVAEQMAPPKLHELVNGLRAHFGTQMIPLGPGAVRGIYRALRANQILGLAGDRDIVHTGVPVEFFGEITLMPSGPAALALRLHTPLLPVHVVRKANDSSQVTIYPPVQLEHTGDREGDIVAGTQRLTGLLEAMIRATPEQWVVFQPIWPDPNPAATPAVAAEGVAGGQLKRA